jgi:hypothetical protein
MVLYSCFGALLPGPIWASSHVYFIRHGEKPDTGNGLSSAGQTRANYISYLFGASAGYYNVGFIIAQANGTKGITSPSFCILIELELTLVIT